MPPTIKVRPTNTFKRTRSTESGSTTPVSGSPRTGTFPDSVKLPPFLRQSENDLKQKFKTLNLQQETRVRQARDSNDAASPFALELTGEMKVRNRYIDIMPWANSRILLKATEGQSDYINASPICLKCSISGIERKYIAAQGPKANNIHHFWQMIWHQTESIAVIVMLTQLAEGMREKCHQYFPDKVEDPPLEVILTDDEGQEVPGSVSCVECNFDEDSKTTVRKITLKRGEEERKEVYHLFFLGWPDFGVPEESDREALLSMIALSRAKNQDSFTHPRTVHCSAGVGRTGTFIALEHLLIELENGVYDSISHRDQNDPIYSTIEQLREQRMTMVQSDAQYNFLYDIMREQYLKRIEEKKIPGEPSPKMLRTAKSFRAVFRRTVSGGLKKLADDNTKAAAAAAEESAGEGSAET